MAVTHKLIIMYIQSEIRGRYKRGQLKQLKYRAIVKTLQPVAT